LRFFRRMLRLLRNADVREFGSPMGFSSSVWSRT
jgi:hypothetical protein